MNSLKNCLELTTKKGSKMKAKETKKCSRCNEVKSIELFRIVQGSGENTRRRTNCKRCESASAVARKRRIEGNPGCTTQDILNEWNKKPEAKDEKINEILFNNLVQGLIGYVSHKLDKLHFVREKEFWDSHTNSKLAAKECGTDFDAIKNAAENILEEEYGLKYPTGIQLGEGVYLVVGDSHGKHMKTKMFQLINNLDSMLNFDNIIHIGHLLDDESIMSYHWKSMEKVIMLTKKNELKRIAELLHDWDAAKVEYKFNIIRDELYLGDLIVKNQDQYPNEYTTVALDKIEQLINQQSSVLNFHRHEMFSKTTDGDHDLLYMSPGSLCDPFVSKTIRTWDYVGRKSHNETFTGGFNKYCRREEFKELWEQGLIVVHVDANGDFTPIMCRIKDVDDLTKATVYLDKVITSDKENFIKTPRSLNLVTGDAHVPLVDPVTNAIITLVTQDIKFDNHINLGDVCQNEAVNHHNISKKKLSKYKDVNFIKDFGCAHHYIKNTLSWAENHYLLYANHERFMRDFTDTWPQFEGMFDLRKLLRLDDLKVELLEHKSLLRKDDALFAHGDILSYGQRGSINEKMARNYDAHNTPIFIGHVHYPSIRFGCYSVGMTGNLDQGYNEPMASRWMHGFGISASYAGIGWNTTIPIINDVLYFNDTHYNRIGDYAQAWENPEEIDFTVGYNY